MDVPTQTTGEELRGLSRRDFLVLSAGTICASMAHHKPAGASQNGRLHHGTAGASDGQTRIGFVESTCRKDGKMENNLLVAYASKCGSTGGVAEAIGQVLCATGASVDVRLVENVRDLGSYRGVVVGSAIRMGRWLPEAVDFVRKNRDVLGRVPAAYFVVCLSMKDDTAENRSKVLAYLDPLRNDTPQMQPTNIGLFPGAVDFSKLSFVHKSVLKAKGVSEGDFRNWASVRTWAADVRPALLGAHLP